MKGLSGADVKRWRTRAGLTQVELARHLGVHKRTVAGWEQGINKPPAMLTAVLQNMAVVRPKGKEQPRGRR
jgi:DNA-binding transcriptional regulator YiaG